MQKEDEGIERRDWHEKKKHLKTKLVGSRMRRAGQRMGEDRLSKRAWKTEEGGRRRRGRPKLRWKVSNEILKGQVRTGKSGKPSQKTEGGSKGKKKTHVKMKKRASETKLEKSENTTPK